MRGGVLRFKRTIARLGWGRLLVRLILFSFSLLFIVGGLGLLWVASLPIPDLDAFRARKIQQSLKLYDRTGEVLLYELYQSTKRTVVPADAIAPAMKQAVVAIEDSEFYEHHGVRPLAIARAVLANLFSLSFEQGGSTITQQVVKNTVLVADKSVVRKVKEWVLALKLDAHYSKDEILTFYLNETPFGGTIYGVEEAAQTFFGKHASELTLAQAAYLAAIPQAPTYYSPYGTHRDALEARKNLVLERMRELGFISPQEYEAAHQEKVTFLPRGSEGIKAPHFVFYTQEWLEERYGRSSLQESGWRVITTLDWNLQEQYEAITKEHALRNEKENKASNAALVALAPQTGEILAMVGSRDYNDEVIDGAFNVITARRQPGSAIKPFVYAQAFLKGFTPQTVVFDVPTQFSTACSPHDLTKTYPCYAPENYDNKFRGPITFREALAQSLNVPSVKVLYLAGISSALNLAHTMGLTSLDPTDTRYGLTLVLGGGEVTPLELASAYGVFATGGVRVEPTPVLRIESSTGEVVWENHSEGRRVLPEAIAATISSILSDNEARTPAFGPNSPLYFPDNFVAAKTGTTNEYRDAWTMGYTTSVVVGAWAGNNDNTPMEKKVASYLIAPLWRKAMEIALTKYTDEPFPEPPPPPTEVKPILRGVWLGNESYVVDTVSGKLATPLTPPETTEERFIPSVHSVLHWVDKDDPLGPPPQNPANDPQYPYWEAGVARWKEQNNINDSLFAPKPTDYDDVHTPENQPIVVVLEPKPNATHHATHALTVSVNATGKFPPRAMEVYVNDVFVGKDETPPLSFTFTPADFSWITPGKAEVRVRVIDEVYNKKEAQALINITP
ncbi:penicillin-binding protein [Candidatus Parcubacteria bacterium]|nr:MAG: penicillin-binding protein [Candidatus Parcubacteria bacterium]GIW68713.1 MAG: hypothetical protein KatS3mg100_207 [Candidatus Parcubacteria bacterium]